MMEDEYPLVSVIIPTYKRVDMLQRAVESVYKQTYNNLELIIINGDPETDINDAIPQSKLAEFNTVRLINQKQNKGVSNSRNRGIDIASGEYVACLDDDDEWLPTKIEKQVNKIKSLDDEYGMVYSSRYIYHSKKDIVTDKNTEQGCLIPEILYKNLIPSETPLIKLECLSDIGRFDESLYYAEDYDLWIRIAKQYKIAVITEPLAIAHTDHTGRLSESEIDIVRGKYQILLKHWKTYISNPRSIIGLVSRIVYHMFLCVIYNIQRQIEKRT